MRTEFLYLAEVLSVYDGDTLTVNLTISVTDHGFKMKSHMIWEGRKIRLFGVNTPEVRGKGKERGYVVRNWVRAQLAPCRRIVVATEKDKEGKYGRLLGTIYYDERYRTVAEIMANGRCLNKELLARGYAVETSY